MILIPVMESMDGILNEMPELVNKLEKNSSEFGNESTAFVKKLETSAEKYRLPIAGQLSVIRGKLLCGAPEPENSNCLTRKEKKAIQKRYILAQLEKAYTCVTEYFSASRKVFDECEKLVCQIIVRLKAKGVFKEYKSSSLTGAELIRLASRDSELAPITVHVTGLVGAINTNILFEKTMSLAGIYNKEEN